MSRSLFLITILSAAIAACGDDDGGTGGGTGGGVGGGTGGGVGGGTGGGVGGGTGGGVGGGTGGGTAATTLNINLRFAQLIPDAKFPDDGTAAPDPGVRICLKAGTWQTVQPAIETNPLGIPSGAITPHTPGPFPNAVTTVVVYPAPAFDAAVGTATNPCRSAAETEVDFEPIATATIDPANDGIVEGGYYTALLTGLIDGSPATLTGLGARPCFDATNMAIDCAGPTLTVLADDLTTSETLNTVRLVNAIPNGGDLELCVTTANLAADPAPAPTGLPYSFVGNGEGAAEPIGVGEATDYFTHAAHVNDGTDGFLLFAAQRRPAQVPEADAGVEAPYACSGLAPANQAAGAVVSVSTIPTPAAITAAYSGANGTGLAASTFVAGEVNTVFLTGLAPAAAPNPAMTPIVPIDDNYVPTIIAP